MHLQRTTEELGILGFALKTDHEIYHIVCETRCTTSHPFSLRFFEEGGSNGVTFVQNPAVPAGYGRTSGVFQVKTIFVLLYQWVGQFS